MKLGKPVFQEDSPGDKTGILFDSLLTTYKDSLMGKKMDICISRSFEITALFMNLIHSIYFSKDNK